MSTITSPIIQQRIYIGGLDPDRLTAREVLARLKTVPGVRIEEITTTKTTTVSFHQDDYLKQQRFVHVQATLVQSLEQKQQESLSHQQQLQDDKTMTPPSTTTATTTTTTTSPLQILQKLYHNVKWKGCKLTVQAAKPHFLERLAQEIQQRKEAQSGVLLSQQQEPTLSTTTTTLSSIVPLLGSSTTTTSSNTLTTTTSTTALTTSSSSRRQLKIRQRHGRTTVLVDTKPWQVNNWTTFERMMQKKKRQRMAAALIQASGADTHTPGHRPVPHQHQQHATRNNGKATPTTINNNNLAIRAVHLRFVAADSDAGENNGTKRANKENNNDDGDDDEEDDDDDGDTSSNNRSSSNNNMIALEQEDDIADHSKSKKSLVDKDTKPPSRYVWSDDDEEDEEDNDDEESSSSIVRERNHRFEEDGEEEETKESHLHVMVDHDKPPYSRALTTTSLALHAAKSQQQQHVVLDEFAAAIDVSQLDDPQDDNDDDDEDDKSDTASWPESPSKQSRDGADDAKDAPLHLQDDIESNLKVLSIIFPDMHVKPMIMVDDEDGSQRTLDANGNRNLFSASSLRRGGGVGMQRYDPTNPVSAQQFEKPFATDMNPLANESSHKQDESQATGDSSKTNDHPETLKATATNTGNSKGPTVKSGYVYEQDQLEQIFRQARSGGDVADGHEEEEEDDGRDQNAPSSFQQATTSASVTGFSFGFHLEQSLPPASPPPVAAVTTPLQPEEKVRAKGLQGDSMTDASLPNGNPVEQSAMDVADQLETHSAVGSPHSQVAVMGDDDAGLEGDEPRAPMQSHLPPRRVAGVWFPPEVLDQYVADFYAMNDGARIMADLEGFRHDPAVQEQWNHERYILTQDWKRKRKFALTKQNNHKRG
jgi:hypothetical protein